MTAFHAWKRRLWGPDYPFENGPPYLTSDGRPLLPNGIQTGPYQGVDDDGPFSAGHPVVLTFTGTATGPLTVGVLIREEDSGLWAGASATFDTGATADDIGEAIAADFTDLNWDGWASAVNALGVVTFTHTETANSEGWVIYAPAKAGAFQTGGGAPVPEPDPCDPKPAKKRARKNA